MSSMTVSANPLNVPTQPSTSSGHLLDIDAEAFRTGFNHAAFRFQHQLADHPLFTLQQLVELSKRLPEDHVKYNSGNVPIGEVLYAGPQNGLSVEETIRRIEECGSWMVLKWAHHDAEYRQLLDCCLDQMQPLSEPLDPGMCRREAFIFITSPHSTTPYHVDPEYSFLLQVRGNKTVSVLPSTHLSELELERYYHTGDYPPFVEACREQAATFTLIPGQGLHIPMATPHWVKNGSEVSVSFSLTFRSLGSERRSIVSSVNNRLRKRGLKPAPYGQSRWRDSAKFYSFRAVRRAGRLLGLTAPPEAKKH
jgi:hypothetical protein